MFEKIISGGQTGADRAGLDVAIDNDILHGGYCPAGRLSEEGAIPSKYELIEMGSDKYHFRTEKNVKESCATIIFTKGPLSRGSKLTKDYCMRHRKPCLHLDFNYEKENKQELFRDFIDNHQVKVINIAGQRKSSAKSIYKLTYDFLSEQLKVNS